MCMHRPAAIVFDVFGTLIRFGGGRLNPYRWLLEGRHQSRSERLPFLSRNVPAEVFAKELGLLHVMPEFRRDLEEELAGLRLFDEVEEVLARLRIAGHRLAVCSNLAYEYGPAVRRLLPNVEAYIFSYEVGATKPDPAIYAAVCESLGYAPGDVVFIGDSKRSDLHGPSAFGMQAHWLDRKGGQTLLDVIEGLA